MIFEWICDGQIRDIHEEVKMMSIKFYYDCSYSLILQFFVAFDNSVTNDRLWHDKYNLRTAQIPSFISEKQAKKVILI